MKYFCFANEKLLVFAEPSAILVGMDTEARSNCEIKPYFSFDGKLSVT